MDNLDEASFSSFNTTVSDDINTIIDSLKNETMPTGILHQYYSKNHPINKYNGKENVEAINQISWEVLLSELEGYKDGSRHSLFSYTDIMRLSETAANDGMVPVFIVDVRFNFVGEQIREEVRNKKLSIKNTSEIMKNLEEISAVFACTILPHLDSFMLNDPAHCGLETTFIIKKEYYITNQKDALNEIEVDFDDGKGFRTVEFDKPVPIQYNNFSVKTIKYKLHYSSSTQMAASTLRIKDNVKRSYDVLWKISATIPYKDEVNEGTAYVLFGNSKGKKHTNIVKPVLITEPFPGISGSFSFDSWNDLLKGILDILLNYGFDIILLSQNKPQDYLQRSAFVTVECIKKILEEQNNPVKGDMIVIGISMGAVIARYALAYMEKNGLSHGSSLYISLDGPHHGMNIPVSVQWMIRKLNDVSGNETTKKYKELFTSMACQQLLYYFVPESYEGKLISKLHTDYYDELTSLGFPKKTFNIGYSAGLRHGKNIIPFNKKVIDWHGYVFADGEVYSLPNNPSDYVLSAKVRVITTTYSSSVAKTLPYDEAPGSIFQFFKLLADALASRHGQADNPYKGSCLVPTISAIDVNNTKDPYTMIENAIGTDSFSNFDLYIIEPSLLPELSGQYMSEQNMPEQNVSEQNGDFIKLFMNLVNFSQVQQRNEEIT